MSTLNTNKALSDKIITFQKELTALGFGSIIIAGNGDVDAVDPETGDELKVASCYLENNNTNLEAMMRGGCMYILEQLSSPVGEV